MDTGSEVSLLPASLVPENQIRPTDYTLRAANGTPIEVLGCAVVPITTGLYSSTVDGVVTNHVTEVMLGADWLSDNNAQWNFVNSTAESEVVSISSVLDREEKSGVVESSCRRESPSSRGHNEMSDAV